MSRKNLVIFIRVIMVLCTLLLQIGFWVALVYILGDYSEYLILILLFSSVICMAYILIQDTYPENKIPWIFIMFTFPLAGGLIYFAFRKARLKKADKHIYANAKAKFLANCSLIKDTGRALLEDNVQALRQSDYLSNHAYAKAHSNTETSYFESGEKKFEAMLEELQAAEKFIFLEYFIIEEGYMWNAIEKILAEKAAQGVDVRVLYDDFGCILTLPPEFPKRLAKLNIDCRVFNPVNHLFDSSFNHRDHRKICIIDGNVGFTGGINLADEYINKKLKYGHWKDTAIMLKGDAVYNLTAMFLAMWSIVTGKIEDCSLFAPTKQYQNDGVVQPFADEPLDDEAVGETLYMSMLNRAENYVYITTPYLVISREMMVSLMTAAKSGVDVRIILPAIPDKKLVHFLSRSYYEILLKAGVKIYEYTPGFIHSKMFVSDDISAVVGTINMDYRSLSLHYECGVWLYGSSSVAKIKEDILNTQKLCQEIRLDNFIHKGAFGFVKVSTLAILRAFASLL